MGNPSGQQRAASKVKMSGSEKNESEQEHKQPSCKTTANKCTKKCVSRANLLLFLVIRFIDFVAVLIAFAV